MASTPDLLETDRTKLRRHAERGSFDRDLANAILDEAYLAHVGVIAGGTPLVLPMTYGREGDVLFLHGAAANGLIKAGNGVEVCVTVTLLDGLVLARSTFHHSMNYRSVVLVGTAEKVVDPDEKWHALDVITDHVVPGRTAAVRPMTDVEVKGTSVLRLPIAEGSVKVRSGGAVDAPEDLDQPAWAGVVPLRLVAGTPIPNDDLLPEVAAGPPPSPELFVRG